MIVSFKIKMSFSLYIVVFAAFAKNFALACNEAECVHKCVNIWTNMRNEINRLGDLRPPCVQDFQRRYPVEEFSGHCENWYRDMQTKKTTHQTYKDEIKNLVPVSLVLRSTANNYNFTSEFRKLKIIMENLSNEDIINRLNNVLDGSCQAVTNSVEFIRKINESCPGNNLQKLHQTIDEYRNLLTDQEKAMFDEGVNSIAQYNPDCEGIFKGVCSKLNKTTEAQIVDMGNNWRSFVAQAKDNLDGGEIDIKGLFEEKCNEINNVPDLQSVVENILLGAAESLDLTVEVCEE